MNQTPQLPVTFWPQIVARLKEKSPKLYQLIIRNSLWFTLASALLPFVITDFLPGIGVDVPQWLTYTNTKMVILFSFLSGMGVGGIGVAATTIQTPATPPLVVEDPKPAEAETATALLLERMASMEAEIQELRQKYANP